MLPVPEAEFLVRPRLARDAPDLLPADAEDTVAHITLLGPFADLPELDEGVHAELTDLFADVLPFGFELTSVSEFPAGTTYLVPEPAAPFRQLTHELVRRFPEFPPYGGEFDDVVPHLSVPTVPAQDHDALRAEIEPLLPITGHAREAALYWWGPGESRTLQVFPFGTTAA
ncbi:MAG TPA: 2'-5' RNA ligase family protein [Nocardioidaceae bacterium]|nr:2'-5' RNA ligase family protein [Nocardioidaceae bacterium]